MEGEEYPLEAGCGFLIEPGQMSFYQADEKESVDVHLGRLCGRARGMKLSKAWGFPRGTGVSFGAVGRALQHCPGHDGS